MPFVKTTPAFALIFSWIRIGKCDVVLVCLNPKVFAEARNVSNCLAQPQVSNEGPLEVTGCHAHGERRVWDQVSPPVTAHLAVYASCHEVGQTAFYCPWLPHMRSPG